METQDYMSILFPVAMTEAERVAGIAQLAQEESARIAAVKAAHAAQQSSKRGNCPKCAGSGRISAYTYIKGGACFLCGGSGVFSGYGA